MGNLKNSLNEGFVRGLVGKEEDSSQARILTSPEPLPNEMLTIRKGYWVCLGLCAVGVLIPYALLFGMMGFVIVYGVDVSVVDHKVNRLRRFKFKISRNANNENLLETMQPIFVSKYNLIVERKQDGVMSIVINGYIYDVHIENDCTFTIWWRMSGGKAMISFNKYKIYRYVLSAMGIIAFEIQKNMGIN
ncbi:MAG: hypothetical protein ACI4VF_01605 [Lachnospirales bacterium]